MIKEYRYILLILSLALLLAGCNLEPALQTTASVETEATVETTIPAETTLPAETEAPTEVPTEAPTEAPATEPAETEGKAEELPYLQHIDRADQSIYAGPGYDYGFVGTVQLRGIYTIVEEAWDWEGNLWGKLKSGVGWVDLTEIRSEEYAEALISANYADENMLLHGAYHYCPGDALEYRIPIAFRAYGTLRDVALFGFNLSDEGYAMGEDFFTLAELNEEMPLVAELAFPGDMSMYGIRFADETGTTHIYSIYISGRNGALVLSEYAP